MQFFFPKRYRNHRLVFYLMFVEFPFVVVTLTLSGVASHNLYSTLLWQDGADNGFNSAPDEALYAAANYKAYKTPMVWSSFLTEYNLVLGVLALFFFIAKFPVHSMHLFHPPLAAIIHLGCFILFIISVRYQAGSDMSDSAHPQPGAPWYITKPCSVAHYSSNIGYCKQSKSLFGVNIVLILIYFAELCVSIHSCFITKKEKAEILAEREEKRIEKHFEEVVLKSPGGIPMTPKFGHGGMAPRTPGFPPTVVGGSMSGTPPSSFTPRTLAFNRLGSQSSDLPLRDNSATSTPHIQSQQTPTANSGGLYFPPPPKSSGKN
ncbi:hypothetical protein N7495_003215 [Penicillium taxi]|uniref:uncharacterized protein n=1 Tax=Penicillium taxi TaxID=168475 RepID=UPI002545BBAA|nr:uncharacterized protein N7495_003215 [Penicillium taxi]KAJ5902687.1 hypothetical protein N7495_003215 [Penicillium taxi]